MSDDNIVRLATGPIGDGAAIDIDSMLEANKGVFRQIVIVGVKHSGDIAVASSHGTPEAMMLLQHGVHFILTN